MFQNYSKIKYMYMKYIGIIMTADLLLLYIEIASHLGSNPDRGSNPNKDSNPNRGKLMFS